MVADKTIGVKIQTKSKTNCKVNLLQVQMECLVLPKYLFILDQKRNELNSNLLL